MERFGKEYANRKPADDARINDGKISGAKVSDGFELLMKETGSVGPAFGQLVKCLSAESALDPKTHDLAYLAVLTALKCYSGMSFHIAEAVHHGATKAEIKSAMLIGMPLVGLQVKDALSYLEP